MESTENWFKLYIGVIKRQLSWGTKFFEMSMYWYGNLWHGTWGALVFMYTLMNKDKYGASFCSKTCTKIFINFIIF